MQERKLTPREAGRLGGRRTAERGPEHFAAIGRKGGAATKARHDMWHFVAIGAKGGTATRSKRGGAWFKSLNAKGPRPSQPTGLTAQA